MSRSSKPAIHTSIKTALGYEAKATDDEVLKDWKARTTRVCKPCWELKYCPYGPLVEQSPTIPPLRDGMIAQNKYFRQCLDTNIVGSVHHLSAQDRDQYESWTTDEQLLLQQARHELACRQVLAEAAKQSSDDEKIAAWIGGSLPPIHIYRVPYEDEDGDIIAADFDPDVWAELCAAAERLREKYRLALESGTIDHRQPLEAARAAWFRKRVEEFNASDYPEAVPEIFGESVCNIFGHVCPVFFAAEASTETSTERRRGRYIPFDVKMRVVRRDNYTCQNCGKHLKDNEVEFDHNIPVSKGGSSEEHNIRLTCFDCNRDKSDDYVP